MRGGALSGSVKSNNPWQSVIQTEYLNHGLDGLLDDTDGNVRGGAPDALSGSVKSNNPWQSVIQTEYLNHGLDGLLDDTDGNVRGGALSRSVKSVHPWQSVIQTDTHQDKDNDHGREDEIRGYHRQGAGLRL